MVFENKRQRKPKGKKELTIQSEKLEDKQNKTNTTQYVLDTTMRKQTQIA